MRNPALLLLVSAALGQAATDYFPPADAKGGWRTLSDRKKIEQVTGIDTAKLDETFEFIKGTSQHGGLLVVRHGWLVYERYYGRGDREATPEMASCGKAFTSVAMGALLGEEPGEFPQGVDTRVFTPKYLPPEVFPLDDPRKADIRLGHLLSMSAGIRGNTPGYVNGKKVPLNPPGLDGFFATIDENALKAPMWCEPGGGYSYATASPHLVSIVLRRIAGMEMQQYIDQRIAKPLEWGLWGYGMHHPKQKLEFQHTPGGGSIALRPTDVLRFLYMLLHEGRWKDRQIVPAEYVKMCGRPNKYNQHYPYSFMFEVNEDGHTAGVPRDAFWKAGAGGFCMYVIPSLDMVVYKMAGVDFQYDPEETDLPIRYKYDGSRDNWTFPNGQLNGRVFETLQRVVAAVR